MDLIQCKGLSKTYGSGNTAVHALRGVDLAVQSGAFVAVVGASGSGKSTLLHLLASVDSPTAGSVQVDGVDVGTLTPTQAALFRRRKGRADLPVFQSYPHLERREEHCHAAAAGQTQARPGAVPKPCTDAWPAGQTACASGPAFRRAAAAGGNCRALCYRPSLLLADEPTGNLDRRNSTEILDLLRLFHRNLNQTILLVTHDEQLAAQADRVITLSDGQIVSDVQRR